MRSIYFHTNPSRDDGTVTIRAIEIAARHGAKPAVSIETCDMVVCLGGDGTILSVAEHAAKNCVPVLGINLGNIGFMTAFDADRLELFDEILEGEFLSDRRSMICAEVNGSTFLVLNDAVITGEPGRTLGVEITVGKSRAAIYRGDGVIAATATGSTAYSMSAGGPIIDPNTHCIILTPICAHTPYARPLVLPDGVHTAIKTDGLATLTVDGNAASRLPQDGVVEITKAAESLELIRLKNFDFYDIMGIKLWNL